MAAAPLLCAGWHSFICTETSLFLMYHSLAGETRTYSGAGLQRPHCKRHVTRFGYSKQPKVRYLPLTQPLPFPTPAHHALPSRSPSAHKHSTHQSHSIAPFHTLSAKKTPAATGCSWRSTNQCPTPGLQLMPESSTSPSAAQDSLGQGMVLSLLPTLHCGLKQGCLKASSASLGSGACPKIISQDRSSKLGFLWVLQEQQGQRNAFSMSWRSLATTGSQLVQRSAHHTAVC